MAGNNTIKIDADLSSIKKGFTDLSNQVKKFSKEKFSRSYWTGN